MMNLIKKINTQYNLIFRDNNFIFKIIEASFILLNEALTIFIIYRFSESILAIYQLNKCIKILILIASFFIIHYVIGAVLLFYNRLEGWDSKGKVLTGDFLISYFLIVGSLFFILLFYKETIKTFTMSFIIADIASYIINMKLLVMFLLLGRRKLKDGDCYNNFAVIMISAFVIVFMIILNLFIGVVIVDGVNPSSFSGCPGVFDLFYYTVATFTTIGFGDIVPLTKLAKTMAVFISGSSIICLSVFLGSIYSIKK
ncbi:MAG: two pore domain potassium channel family protein [Clostridium sp.]|nr:two pore domain potassium channel family protein [Clostridium sp.]